MIEAAGLTKIYGSVTALDGVDLSVPGRTILTVLGPNGSGKTTLLRLLATLTRPTSGRGRIAGHDLVRDRAMVRRAIGLIGHGTQLYPDLTALENLAFAAALGGHRPPRSRLLGALARLGLEAQADLRVRDLSSGMQRRVALARVVLREPSVLLLDEPFTGLDQESLKRWTEYLHAFKAGGGAVVLVTHSLGRGLELADRVAILAGGRLAVDQPRGSLTPEGLRQLYVTATEP
ncbi:MAG TPA: heme ABC exporter ATP-binding protein CcmA [Solirubrobacterales bacterium]|nr:heme ABC exporter ATP-binding protein CcmA [Solirubrobacterales bacterium]